MQCTPSICRARVGGVPPGVALPALVLLTCLLLIAPGCQVATPATLGGARVHEAKDISVNAEQMRLRMRSLVQPMSAEIAASADRIIADAPDPAVRREALLWKIQAIPALREALFQPNPTLAVFDAWLLTFQMIDYFATGPGKQALGESSAIALATSKDLEAEISRIANSMTFSGDASNLQDFARACATSHPIRHSIAGRESALSLVLERDLPATFSTSEAVGSLVVSADDLNRRMEIYSAQLPEQSRWQAELFADDLVGTYRLDQAVPLAERAVATADRAVATLDRTMPAIEQSLTVVKRVPALVASEREAATSSVTAEVTRALRSIQDERITAFKQITLERTAGVKDVVDSLAQERKALALNADALAVKAIDHAVLRAAQLCAAALLVAFVGAMLLILLIRRLFPFRSALATRALRLQVRGVPAATDVLPTAARPPAPTTTSVR